MIRRGEKIRRAEVDNGGICFSRIPHWMMRLPNIARIAASKTTQCSVSSLFPWGCFAVNKEHIEIETDKKILPRHNRGQWLASIKAELCNLSAWWISAQNDLQIRFVLRSLAWKYVSSCSTTLGRKIRQGGCDRPHKPLMIIVWTGQVIACVESSI